MSKVIVFAGEGKSEFAFFSSFIKNKLGFIAPEMKGGMIFQKGNIYCIMGHPKMGSTHQGGYDTLLSSKTYIELHSKIKNAISAEMLPERNQYTYIVLLDADKGGKKIKAVEEKLPSLLQQYLSNYQGNSIVIPVKQEIENWFLAGLGDAFCEVYPDVDKAALQSLLTPSLEDLPNAKEMLNKILKNTDIAGRVELIGNTFGEYIDIEQATTYSASFRSFMEIVNEFCRE